MFVYGTLDHFIDDTHGDGLFLTIAVGVRDILPAASDIDGLPGMGIAGILTAVSDFVQPVLTALPAAEVTLYDKPGTIYYRAFRDNKARLEPA